MNTGVVNIKGKSYKTVALRVAEFRELCPAKDGWSIETEVLHRDADTVVMLAFIRTPEGRTIATGCAEEQRASSQINRTSALENCETSAIGRALAAFGLGGSEYASANEVANAIHQQAEPKATDEDKKYIADAAEYIAGVPTVEQLEAYYLKHISTRGTAVESALRPLCAQRKQELKG